MYRQEKKIPTILALLILFVGILAAVFLNQSVQQLSTTAKSTPPPKDTHFTNITDNSFTISWFSSNPINGSVVVSDRAKSITYLDDLDTDNISRPRSTHYTTVRNLQENTSYTVKIISGENNCKNQSDCPAFVQKTGIKLASITTLPPARGSIVTETQQPADTAIVYLIVGKSSLLSGRVDTAGLWVIPMNNLRSGDLLSKPSLSDNDIVQITAQIAPGEKTEAVIDVASIRQNLTIPPLQIGKSYNLIDLISKKDMLAALNRSSNILGAQTQETRENVSSISTSNKSIDILFPAYDDDTTTDSQPRFRGIGPAGAQLIIIVNSTPQTGKIFVGADGTWSWRPPQSLPPGIHHLGIQGYDAQGNYITVTRKFIVLKSGERVLGEATASATLTPTTPPTATPTKIQTTTTPFLSPTPTVSSLSATPVKTPPATGNIESTLILLGGGLTLLLLGIKFLLFP